MSYVKYVILYGIYLILTSKYQNKMKNQPSNLGRDTPKRLYKAPTDYTKPRNITQSPRHTIQDFQY